MWFYAAAGFVILCGILGVVYFDDVFAKNRQLSSAEEYEIIED